MSSSVTTIINMSKWNADSGILRKKQTKDKHEDLLVFGYACKLFRDDEKALYIDQGKHLIPWMGDESLKIDRYDGRGALSELASCEASREGYDAMRWLGLSESERRIEQLCDEERYYALRNNEEEEALYKEEESKRLQQKSNEFQYNYDAQSDKQNVEETVERQEEVEPFVPPPELDVPVDIPIPKTPKENHRIEKTADFVCRQGPQMEILIKAKQGDNPQFAFMNQDNPLYKYYRHVLSAIKDGRYKVKSVTETENKQEASEQDASTDEHYLHPSLLTAATQPATVQQQQQQQLQPPPPPLPVVPYKPSADCAYSQLVNRIQGGSSAANVGEVQPSQQQMSYEQQQQYYQYYYASQYYEYYKQMSQYQAQSEGVPDLNLYNQYLQQVGNNPYAQIVSNLNKDVPMENNVPKTAAVVAAQNKKEPETTATKPFLALADYGSGSDVDDDDDGTTASGSCIKIPPGDIKIIIDKMAAYVAKNGADFEKIVRSKGDPRFNFLDETHDYHPYYKSKIKEHSQDAGKEEQNKTDKEETSEKDQNGLEIKTKEKKPIAPVCFSIKKPKEDAPKEIKSALPAEESDEDAPNAPEASSDAPQDKKQETDDLNNKDAVDADDPILEMIDLTDDNEEKRDAKRAEDRIKDKLAAAAREKLASVTRDRALQLERRKKALAFVKMKVSSKTQSEDKTKNAETTASGAPETKTEATVQIVEDTDSDEGETKSRKSSRHRHKHKRKHSKSKHESKSHHRKSKKKRRKSGSYSGSETSHVS